MGLTTILKEGKARGRGPQDIGTGDQMEVDGRCVNVIGDPESTMKMEEVLVRVALFLS